MTALGKGVILSLGVLKEKVLGFIYQNKLISPGEKVLVGVSGGPDSVCLLHILSELSGKLGINLIAAYLNHKLRKEAEEDSHYVQKLCLNLNIPLILGERDVAGYRKECHLSLEEAARMVRYNFLKDAALSSGSSKIAVAHTLDDQIETILLNLVRGTGLRGLTGMSYLSYWQGFPVIRPLLEVSRRETEGYCRVNNLNPRQDLSNLELRFRRNFLRHKVIPLLVKINPRFKESLLSLSHSLALDWAFIEEELKKQDGIISRVGDSFRIDREGWLKLPEALKARLLLKLAQELGISLESKHIALIKAVKHSGKRLNLPGGLKLFWEQKHLWLTLSEPPCPYPELKGSFQVNIPGVTLIGGWKVEARVIPTEGIKLSADPFLAHLDMDKSGDRIFVRPRSPGDRFCPLGLKGTKKLQDFMVEAKIPGSWRDRIPVVVSDRHILWLVGYRIDERVKIAPQTKRVLELKFDYL